MFANNKITAQKPTLKAYQQSQFKLQEREELKNLHRNLKIQFNITTDENTRLRTRLSSLAMDLQKKEKEMEQLMRKA
jgi:hypothetical protein